MSRTDKTKPLWVRCAEHDPRPVHDHRSGPCDLPQDLTRALTRALTRPLAHGEPGTRCRWEYTEFGRTCCSGCHGRASKREMGVLNRAENRRARHAARREARRRVVTGEYGD